MLFTVETMRHDCLGSLAEIIDAMRWKWTVPLLSAAMCGCAGTRAAEPVSAQWFDDESRLIRDQAGTGALAYFDANRDGREDLLVTSFARMHGAEAFGVRMLLRSDSGFRDICPVPEASVTLANGLARGDYDGDGISDLYVTGVEDPNRLLKGRGDGTFVDVTAAAEVAWPGAATYRTSTSFVDYDRDGDLDLYVGNLAGTDKLFRNNGNGSFTDVTVSTGLTAEGHTTHHMFGDLDGDGWPDLVVATRNVDLPAWSPTLTLPTRLYRNEQDGTFRDVSRQSGVDLPLLPIEGVLLFDADNDGDLDLLLTGIRHEQPNLFYRNRGNGIFDEDTERSGLAGANTFSLGVAAADFDNDGWLDVFVATAGINQIFHNRRDGTFEEIGVRAGLRTDAHSFIPAAVDLNEDGWLDIVVSNGWSGRSGKAANEVWRNRLGDRGSRNGSLTIELAAGGRNRDAIGSRVRVIAGPLRMKREINGGNGYGGGAAKVHFGLGTAREADSVVVRWPSGAVSIRTRIPAGSILRIREGSATNEPPPRLGGAGTAPTDSGLDAMVGTWRDRDEEIVIARTATRLVSYFPATGAVRVMAPDDARTWRAGEVLLRQEPAAFLMYGVGDSGGIARELVIAPVDGREYSAVRDQSYRIENVFFYSGSVRLAGRLFVPTSAGPHPGVVLVHGSGPQDRYGPLGYYDLMAHRFAQAGFAAIAFDKRGVGQSAGTWRTASFADLAADVNAAARFLAARPDGDDDAVGLWGISQAGWVAARAVAERPRTAFVTLASAGGSAMTPAEQNTFNVVSELAAAGTDDSVINDAVRAWSLLYGLATGATRQSPALDSLLTRLRGAGVPDGLLPPRPREIDWDRRDAWFLSLNLAFDPLPVWAAYDGPILFVLGERDLATPTDTVAVRLRQLAAATEQPRSVVIHPGADHFLLDSEGGLLARLAERVRFVPDALEGMVRWAAETVRPQVDCAAFPAADSALYALPYAVGAAFLVTNTSGHFRRANGGVGLYAIDFAMQIGTPIHAARAGVVVAVRDSFADGNGVDLQENFVFVRHADGTIGRYFHLTMDGARVNVGDRVEQGDLLGLSGNTGRTAGPHLHFDVQRCGPNLPPRYNALPCGETLPITFANTTPHSCGLRTGVRYPARQARP